MTSSNRNIIRVTGPLRGEFNGRRWIPLTKTSDARLSKQSGGWWFETPLRQFWRHCNATFSFNKMRFKISLARWRLFCLDLNVLLRYGVLGTQDTPTSNRTHNDVIKWKNFPRYWPFVRGIHRSSVNSPHKGQWRGALILSLIYVWINIWVNNNKAVDSRRYRVHYDFSVMCKADSVEHRKPAVTN